MTPPLHLAATLPLATYHRTHRISAPPPILPPTYTHPPFGARAGLLHSYPQSGEVTGFDDVFTKLEKAKAHYEAVGLGAEYVEQFVR